MTLPKTSCKKPSRVVTWGYHYIEPISWGTHTGRGGAGR
jgi:hypothetical protein